MLPKILIVNEGKDDGSSYFIASLSNLEALAGAGAKDGEEMTVGVYKLVAKNVIRRPVRLPEIVRAIKVRT